MLLSEYKSCYTFAKDLWLWAVIPRQSVSFSDSSLTPTHHVWCDSPGKLWCAVIMIFEWWLLVCNWNTGMLSPHPTPLVPAVPLIQEQWFPQTSLMLLTGGKQIHFLCYLFLIYSSKPAATLTCDSVSLTLSCMCHNIQTTCDKQHGDSILLQIYILRNCFFMVNGGSASPNSTYTSLYFTAQPTQNQLIIS